MATAKGQGRFHQLTSEGWLTVLSNNDDLKRRSAERTDQPRRLDYPVSLNRHEIHNRTKLLNTRQSSQKY